MINKSHKQHRNIWDLQKWLTDCQPSSDNHHVDNQRGKFQIKFALFNHIHSTWDGKNVTYKEKRMNMVTWSPWEPTKLSLAQLVDKVNTGRHCGPTTKSLKNKIALSCSESPLRSTVGWKEYVQYTQPQLFLINISRNSVFDLGISSPLGLEEVATWGLPQPRGRATLRGTANVLEPVSFRWPPRRCPTVGGPARPRPPGYSTTKDATIVNSNVYLRHL